MPPYSVRANVLPFKLSSSLDSSGGLAGLSGGVLLAIGLGLDMVVLLTGGIDGDLNGNLATLNLLAVHLGAGLLLKLLGAQSNETEATALARLVAGLELLHHESRNGAEGDLGRGRLVVLEDLHELF